MLKNIGDLRSSGVSRLVRLLATASEIQMTEDLAKKLGEQIRALRKKRDLTQVDLSETVGLTQGYISDLENGFGWPSPDTLVALAAALGVEVYEMFKPIGEVTTKEQEIPLKKAINRLFKGLKDGEITLNEQGSPKIRGKKKQLRD